MQARLVKYINFGRWIKTAQNLKVSNEPPRPDQRITPMTTASRHVLDVIIT